MAIASTGFAPEPPGSGDVPGLPPPVPVPTGPLVVPPRSPDRCRWVRAQGTPPVQLTLEVAAGPQGDRDRAALEAQLDTWKRLMAEAVGDRCDLTLVQRSRRLSVVVPTYGEAANIQGLLGRLVAVLDRAIADDYEIIVVDDDSPDRTWALALVVAATHPQIRVVRRTGERGLATAIVRGWQVATGDVLAAIDGDGQHDETILPLLLERIETGADFAIASRNEAGGGVSDWNLWRRLASRGAQLIGLAILPAVVGRVSDPMSGFFAVRRSAIAGQPLDPVGYKIAIEVLARGAIARIAAVPYEFRERQHGETKVTWRHALDYLHHLLRLRLARSPLRRFIPFAIVGLSGVFVDMTVLYLLSDPSTLGWGLTRSKAIAAEIAILNNFLWNDAWTFRDLARPQRSQRQRLERFLKFNAICLLGLGLNVAILNFFFNVVFDRQHRYLANAIAIAIVTFWNFWLNTQFNWRVTAPPHRADPP